MIVLYIFWYLPMSLRKRDTLFFFLITTISGKSTFYLSLILILFQYFKEIILTKIATPILFYGLLKYDFYNTISLFKKGYVLLKKFKRNFCIFFYEKLENLFWRQVTHWIDWNWCDTCKCMILHLCNLIWDSSILWRISV